MRPDLDTYMQSEHWHSLRAQALTTYGGKCELCGSQPSNPIIHHLLYRQLYDVSVLDLAVVCESCRCQILRYKKKHPKAHKTRQKLMGWYRCHISNIEGQRRKAAEESLSFDDKAKITITRLVSLQKKHGSQYTKNKLKNAKGFFYPPKPRNPTPNFRTFSSGEYQQDHDDTHRTVSGSESLCPVPCAKNQVNVDRNHQAFIK